MPCAIIAASRAPARSRSQASSPSVPSGPAVRSGGAHRAIEWLAGDRLSAVVTAILSDLPVDDDLIGPITDRGERPLADQVLGEVLAPPVGGADGVGDHEVVLAGERDAALARHAVPG